MTPARRVMWKEGMFLRAQHFQQQDRRVESLAAQRAAQLQPFHWGFARLALDPGLLEAGKVGFAEEGAAGAFKDGTPFDAPGDAFVPKPVAVPPEAAPCLVWLAAPEATPGAPLARPQGEGARFAVAPEDLRNLLDPDARPEPVELGRLDLALHAGERPAGWDALPVARVLEVAQGRVRLDPGFAPPLLDVAASPVILRLLRDVSARLEAKAADLAGPLGTAGGLSSAALQQLVMLQLCNGKGARLGHLHRLGRLHPERLYTELLETAAELACHAGGNSLRPGALPAYDHDDPAACLPPVAEAILAALGELDDPDAYAIPLDWHPGMGAFYNRSLPADAVEGARLILLASADMAERQLATALPNYVTIGQTQGFRDLLGGASSGLEVHHHVTWPPQLRHRAGWLCFELDRKSEAWPGIERSRTIAIHAQDALAGLQLELWAVKG